MAADAPRRESSSGSLAVALLAFVVCCGLPLLVVAGGASLAGFAAGPWLAVAALGVVTVIVWRVHRHRHCRVPRAGDDARSAVGTDWGGRD